MTVEHVATIGCDFISGEYDVECSCGFTKGGLPTLSGGQEVLREHRESAPLHPADEADPTAHSGDSPRAFGSEP